MEISLQNTIFLPLKYFFNSGIILLIFLEDIKKTNVSPEFEILLKNPVPKKGWVQAIRKAYKMSLRQFGERLHITAPSAEGIEKREKEGTITLRSLEDAGRALNMKLVYGFVPIDGSIENTIKNRAKEVALD